MKLRFGIRPFLPIILLGLAALLACTGESAAPPATPSQAPTALLVEPARPLSADEQSAVRQFEDALLEIEAKRDEFYGEFDGWRSGVVACHPSSAHEALREFAASFGEVADAAGSLPRTPVTGALADLVIAATDAEFMALRNLRDRWQGGNIAFFESVEQGRAASGLAHNTVIDMSLSMQKELQDGPTLDEIDAMQAFSESFDAVADAWDDFHDGYAAFARRESRLDGEAVAAEYEGLLRELRGILAAIEGLTGSDINEDMIERLQDAAEDELALLEFLAEFPPRFDGAIGDDSGQAFVPDSMAGSQSSPAPQITPTPESPEDESGGADGAPDAGPEQQIAPTPEPANGEGNGAGEDHQAAQQSGQQAAANGTGSDAAGEKGEGQEADLSSREELAATIKGTQATLEELEQSIKELIQNDSAQQLEELLAFDEGLAGFVDTWNRFYEEFTEWRVSEGGCDRVAVLVDLSQFSRQASELAAAVGALPQSGPLASVYGLVAEAADREAGAFRTLSNSWTPFAVDVFKAVDNERATAEAFRRQAGIALEELRNRQQ